MSLLNLLNKIVVDGETTIKNNVITNSKCKSSIKVNSKKLKDLETFFTAINKTFNTFAELTSYLKETKDNVRNKMACIALIKDQDSKEIYKYLSHDTVLSKKIKQTQQEIIEDLFDEKFDEANSIKKFQGLVKDALTQYNREIGDMEYSEELVDKVGIELYNDFIDTFKTDPSKFENDYPYWYDYDPDSDVNEYPSVDEIIKLYL